MTGNSATLAAINQQAIITQIYEMSVSCRLRWNLIAPGQFQAAFDVYDLYLTQTQYGSYSLDVLRDGGFYKSYNDTQQPDLAVLYAFLDRTIIRGSKARSLSKILGSLQGCHFHYDFFGSGGAYCATATATVRSSITVQVGSGGPEMASIANVNVQYWWLNPTHGVLGSGIADVAVLSPSRSFSSAFGH